MKNYRFLGFFYKPEKITTIAPETITTIRVKDAWAEWWGGW